MVLDANVLAAGAVAREGAVARIISAWLLEDRLAVALSTQILDELERALEKPYFTRRIDRALRRSFVALVRRQSDLIAVKTILTGVTGHPKDNPVLATAIDGRAPYLVTGDHHLLQVSRYRGVLVLRPRQFVDLLWLSIFGGTIEP